MSEGLRDQTPPQNIDAEKAVLGAIFLSGDALVDAMEQLQAEDFYRRANQLIFQVMVDLNDRDEAIDVVTVTDELTRQNQLDDVGGMPYIGELATSVPTAANVGYYAKIVSDKATLRRLIQTATKIVTEGYTEDAPVSELLDSAEQAIMNVTEARNQSGFKMIKDVLNNTFEEIDRLSQQGDTITGLSTGYPDLDKMTTGLHDDELMILAARPAVGKTAFALNIAQTWGRKRIRPLPSSVWK